MKRIFYFLIPLLWVACENDDSFSPNASLRLEFSKDTVSMDTLFSRTPSSTKSFWVYNRNDEGIRFSSVRLQRGNQTGFRVNVDGIYLDNSNGSQTSSVEIRRKDSILVFVEMTAMETLQEEPLQIEDHLVFSMESGAEQRVCLQAWAWDAQKLYSPVITKDTLIESSTPIIIYGGLTVEQGVNLTLRNTTLYFHDGAGIDVHGSLQTENCVMRGDRLDRMFAYLPYDRVCGQWRGLRFYETSASNILQDTEIRNTMDAIICDSAMIDSTQVRLRMTRCVVHNCDGYGVMAVNTNLVLDHCQLTNTHADCLSIVGGIAEINYCTLAQFYPFMADRGAALRFSNLLPLRRLRCVGSILTGYEDDVLMGELGGDQVAEYRFDNTLLRTPKVNTVDSLRFTSIHWETSSDSIQGKQHFRTIDEKNFYYDFHLDSLSTAQGLGCYQ